MILLADSGSTKTDWCLIKEDGSIICEVSTRGTNPFFETEEEISDEIGNGLVPLLPSGVIDDLYFYGAGSGFPDKIEIVKRAINRHLRIQHIEVDSDVLAAARALCGHKAGIACILGTGSNSCLYDGVNITKNVSPLGYILGDEGSGAYFGKILVGDVLKKQLPDTLCNKFMKQYHLTSVEIIDHVYRKPFPNRFLASLTIFLQQNINHPAIESILIDGFKAFFKRNIMQYENYDKSPIHFIGSIAYFYQRELRKAADEMNITVGKIIKKPMKGLIEYHRM